MRLIDADELNEYIGREALDTREKIFALVHRMPTVEPKHGEWVLDKEFSFVFNMYECSKCRFNGSKRWHFCPNCGADMRVKTDFN